MRDMSIALALLVNACGLFFIAAILSTPPECTARTYEPNAHHSIGVVDLDEWPGPVQEPTPPAEMPEVSR